METLIVIFWGKDEAVYHKAIAHITLHISFLDHQFSVFPNHHSGQGGMFHMLFYHLCLHACLC